jgi:hypothetical protein
MANGYIRYANQGATRRQQLNEKLVAALGFLPELGVEMEVFSGGQPGKGSGLPRVGSVRHDHGNAADVFFYKDGRRLDWNNPQDVPLYQEIVKRGQAAGVTGFGAGSGYMQPGSMHVGFGAPAVWGAGGKSRNAPKWLREAYAGAPAGAAQPVAYQPAGGGSANDIEQYIQQAAQRRGIDPSIAVKVAKSEGLAPGVWQSNVVKNGRRETSYGPFQLLVGGGLGDKFKQTTGLDPSDPTSAYQQVDFALDEAAQGGWGPWYGAAKVGVGRWDGLKGAKPLGVTPTLGEGALDFARNNPQPGGFGPQIDRQAFGGGFGAGFGPAQSAPAAPAGNQPVNTPFKLPQAVADYASSGGKGSGIGKIGKFLSALGSASPDAPSGHLSGGGDARATGDLLAKTLAAGPTIADLLVKRLMRGILG